MATSKPCIPQSLQDTKCKCVGTLMNSKKNANDVNVAQKLCNNNCNSGDISTNLQSISVLMHSYQVTSNENTNVSIVQNLCSIKYSNVHTTTDSQSILVPKNSFQDTPATEPKECFVFDEFTEYFKGFCAGAPNPVAVKNAACTSKKFSRGCSEHIGNQDKTCIDDAGVQRKNHTDDAGDWRSILTERVRDWRKIALETSADLAASAHFFHDSLEANFMFLNNGQKHRVAELVTKLKDAMNFFSIEEDSARLLFFCHACRRHVPSRKVEVHVINEEHLRKLRTETKKLLQRDHEQSNNPSRNVVEPKTHYPLDVYNHYFRDFCATVKNSAHKTEKVNTIQAEYTGDLCRIVSKSQKRPLNLSKTLVECSDTKISKIKRIEFSNWRVKREVPDCSDDDA